MKWVVLGLLAAGVVWFAVETAPLAALYLVVSSSLFGFLILMGFSSLAHAKYMLQSGTDLTDFWRVFYTIELVIFVVADFVWNCTIAWVMFLEAPKLFKREWLFTGRCQRWKKAELKGRSTRRGRLGTWWCKQLNQADPGHC